MFFKRLFKKDKYYCFYGTRQYGKTNYELRKEVEKLKIELDEANSTNAILSRRIIKSIDCIKRNKYKIDKDKLIKILSGEPYKTFNDIIERNSENGQK